MELILQTTSETCGQACVAMITGKSIEEVIQAMKTEGPTSIGQLIEILAILTVHMDAGYTHWTLLYDGKYYDPELGLVEGEYTHGKVTSFLAIYEK